MTALHWPNRETDSSINWPKTLLHLPLAIRPSLFVEACTGSLRTQESEKETYMCGWRNKGQHIRMMALCIITLNMEPRHWFITETGLTSQHGHFLRYLALPFTFFLLLPFILSFSFHSTLTWRQGNSNFHHFHKHLTLLNQNKCNWVKVCIF